MHRFLITIVLLTVVASPIFAQQKERKVKTPLDQAIERALDFLHSSQDSEGAWGAGYRGGKNPAISALSVMAFMSAVRPSFPPCHPCRIPSCQSFRHGKSCTRRPATRR